MLPKQIESNVESFLQAFECLAVANDWVEDKYLAIIQTQFSPKALKVFVELPNDDTYEDTKAALLLAYKVVPEVEIKKFRTQCKSEKDTYADHAYNLNTLFKKWATSLHEYNNLERLREIILLDRFYESVSDDLRVWLVDKDPQTLVEAAKLPTFQG